MIEFRDITKGFWVRGEYRPVIRALNLTLPTGRSLALLGRNGAGKSTLLNMVSGTMRPDTGDIISDGSISFTVGYAGSFHGDMTGAQNTRFLARVYGVDTDELCDFVEDFAEIGSHFHMPVRTYSSGMKSRLAFGVSMGIRFDTYLIDEATATGDARFRHKSKEVFRARMAEASAVMVSHSMGDIRAFCDAGLVLNDGQIEVFEDVEDAIKRHQELLA
ncbi:ABC transporter ATP-binding protein [Roseinatronobacter bogoriensis]|uniref:ABC transporter ATP-binding protein n=1 Tax=Roseinatronobacter bogoriensis subsp. barguzinensis TaxID=441209 RepID=A0A2K8K816_9RHOB|nr:MULTISPECIES: ABC transporter ATP-binding protein [Rhodobaca]ATX65597.1 ABC transporter ATP-binding protein [Rhodobaca barguzinensis]MBB4208471.1 capsular polysaccharide transport system ATP-binding protein [Rhodobaca bogoriensis DSM 18756]TDW39111.1 capsular polysaccharide transport system ATP-binding protein [Rhodobaca barguzinensis]TDY66431.1 capsular polysaccharide transport system ATP-binding protein [Rhodobaca bogoriensis DSM 18756]